MGVQRRRLWEVVAAYRVQCRALVGLEMDGMIESGKWGKENPTYLSRRDDLVLASAKSVKSCYNCL
jgi:hypothetical protein